MKKELRRKFGRYNAEIPRKLAVVGNVQMITLGEGFSSRS